jgi:hypothetical protein
MSDTHLPRQSDLAMLLRRPIGAWPAALVLRICLILLALVATCAAAAFFLTAVDAILEPEWRDVPLAMVVPADFTMHLVLITTCLLPPALVVAALCEYFGLRSAWLCVAAGVGIPAGYLAWSGRAYAYFDGFLPTADAVIFFPACAAAGVISGLAYWWIAARKSQAWCNVTIGRGAMILGSTAIVVGLAVLIAPSAAGFHGLLFPADTDAAWESKVGWRLCNDAIAAWPKKAALACWKLQLCDDEGGLSEAERRRLQQMMAETKCEN